MASRLDCSLIGTPNTLVITGVESGSPAANVQIAAGDVVKNFTDAQSFIDFINAHRGQPIQIALLRSGTEIDVTVAPRVTVGPGEGPIGVALCKGGRPASRSFGPFGTDYEHPSSSPA